MTECELWACAETLRQRYGSDASVRASMRVDAMLADGDAAGRAVWITILERVRRLEAVRLEHEPLH